MESSAATAPRRRATTAEPVLAAEGLVKRYGTRVALAGVSLEAGRGERVAVIGPNGAGKTTLLSILAGVQRADAGRVGVVPRRLGWVPQQAAVYRRLTVEQNLRLFARLERCPDVARAVERMLDEAGLRERAGEETGRLSNGNRQRLNVAVGLLAQPPVLLLDEPSAALDPRQRERLWQFLVARAEAGTAIVYSTHDVREAERFAQQVLVLAEGELLFSGSPRELERLVGATAPDFEAAFVAFLRQHGH